MLRTRIPHAIAIVWLCAAPAAPAGIAKSGPEFQINTYTTNSQYDSQIATNSAGEFVVVWTSYVNYGASGTVSGRQFDSAGTPLGNEFQINTYTTGYQRSPSVAMSDSDGFVVVWSGYGQDGPSDGIIGRLFDSGGFPLGGDFGVNAFTTGTQNSPRIASGSGGDLVVVWDGDGAGDTSGIFGRRFDSAGNPLGGDFPINTYTTSSQFNPSMATNTDGDFVVTWISTNQDGSSNGIFAQRFDASASPLGSEFQVNVFTTGEQSNPSVGMSKSGAFVIAWESNGQDGSEFGIFARRYDRTGTPGQEFQVNTYTTGTQAQPAIVSGGAGDFVVAWVSDQDGSGGGIFARRYDSTGSPAGLEFQVNTHTTASQSRPAIRGLTEGGFVVSWSSYQQDGNLRGVFGQRFAATFTINEPLEGNTLDCHGPPFSGPTIKWDPAGYDAFRVRLSPVPGFLKGTVVSSGDDFLKRPTWTVTPRKWRNACGKALVENPAMPILFIEIYGVDRNLPKNDPNRKMHSPAIQVNLTP